MPRKIKPKKEKRIVAAARKQLGKKCPKNKSVAKKLKIQVVSPWKRVVLGVISVVLFCVGVFISESSREAMYVLGVIGFLIAVLAIFGSRKTIDNVLNGLDAGVSNRIIDSIFDGIF